MPDSVDPKKPHEIPSGFLLKIVVATFCRFVLNTARRFAYPFAPVLSRGLGVPLTAVTSLIAVNQATGIMGIFFGPFTDRVGYRRLMFAAMGMLCFGMFTAGVLPSYGAVLLALCLAGLGKSIFDPALQSYVSRKVSFERRGMIIGLLELSWAGSTLFGIPMIGFFIEKGGWRAPFFLLGSLGVLGLAGLVMLIPKAGKVPGDVEKAVNFINTWKLLLKRRRAIGALMFGFLTSIANDNLFVVYGAWLENSFDVSIVVLGLCTGVIGVAELFGEFATAGFSDRFGLKRSVFAGLGLSMVCYATLPFLDAAIFQALVGLFFLFFAFEFTIVTFLSLCTELMPESRATMMSGFFAAAGVGRIVGALIGGPIWLSGGIVATGSVSAAITGMAVMALWWGLPERLKKKPI